MFVILVVVIFSFNKNKDKLYIEVVKVLLLPVCNKKRYKDFVFLQVHTSFHEDYTIVSVRQLFSHHSFAKVP